MNGGKVERCSRIKDRNGRLALGEDKLQRILKSKFHSTCVALMAFGEVTTSEKSQLEELRLR